MVIYSHNTAMGTATVTIVFLLCNICTSILAAGRQSHTNSHDDVKLDDEKGELTLQPNFTVMEPIRTFMTSDKIVSVNYVIPCRKDQNEITVTISSMSEKVFTISSNRTLRLPCDTFIQRPGFEGNITADGLDTDFRQANGTVHITIHGQLLGLSQLVFVVHENISGDIPDEQRRQVLPVAIMRNMRLFDKIFNKVVPVMIIFILVGFGCKLDLGIVKECLKKPIAPGIGFGCQYLLMPLIGFTIAKVLPIDDPSVTFGIFVCGICPGGGISNIYTYLLDGDVSLSITMTFISSIASIGMMPLWIYTLGRTFLNDDFHIVIPYLNMVQVIATIVIPLLVGIAIKWKWPKAAVAIMKVLKPVMIISMVVFLTLGIYSNWIVFQLFKPLHVLAGSMLPYFGYLLGGTIAAIFKQSKARIVTIALETGMQNVGIALMVIIMSFPPPLGDIARIAPMTSALMTPVLPFFVFIGYTVYKKCCKKYEPVDVDDHEVKIALKSNGDIEQNGQSKVNEKEKVKRIV